MSTSQMEVESMDCLQDFGQFKQVSNYNGLKQKCLFKASFGFSYTESSIVNGFKTYVTE